MKLFIFIKGGHRFLKKERTALKKKKYPLHEENYWNPYNGFHPLMAEDIRVPITLFSALLENIQVYIIP